MGRFYRWLGWSRQREVYKICIKHFDKVVCVVEKLHEFIIKFKNCEVEGCKKLFSEIFNLEREADNIKESIILELSQGPLQPIDREDIMRLMLTIDDIAAHAKAAARKLSFVDPCYIPEHIRNSLVELVEMSCGAVKHLKEAIYNLIKKPQLSIDEAEKVERIEEEVDEYRVNLIADILKWGDTTNKVSHWLMVKEAIENIENMTDKMEDTADVIRGLAITG